MPAQPLGGDLDLHAHARGLLQVVSVPVSLDGEPPAVSAA